MKKRRRGMPPPRVGQGRVSQGEHTQRADLYTLGASRYGCILYDANGERFGTMDALTRKRIIEKPKLDKGVKDMAPAPRRRPPREVT